MGTAKDTKDEVGEAEYTQQQEQRMLERLKKQAKRLGYVLTPQEA